MDQDKINVARDRVRQLYQESTSELKNLSSLFMNEIERKKMLADRFKSLVGRVVKEMNLTTIDDRQQLQCTLLVAFPNEAKGEMEEDKTDNEQRQMLGICPLLA